MLTTHRALQLHCLADDLRAKASQCARASENLARIRNVKGEAIYRHRALRYALVALIVQARLDRDVLELEASRWETLREGCRARLQPALERRPCNALNVEIGQPSERCIDRAPAHLRGMGLRWLASGGDMFVFGRCSFAVCPKRLVVEVA